MRNYSIFSRARRSLRVNLGNSLFHLASVEEGSHHGTYPASVAHRLILSNIIYDRKLLLVVILTPFVPADTVP